MIGSDNVIVASYKTTLDLSNKLLEGLMEEDSPTGYGMLACALTISRLMNPTDHLTPEEQVQFTQDLMSWASSYYGAGKGKAHS